MGQWASECHHNFGGYRWSYRWIRQIFIPDKKISVIVTFRKNILPVMFSPVLRGASEIENGISFTTGTA